MGLKFEKLPPDLFRIQFNIEVFGFGIGLGGKMYQDYELNDSDFCGGSRAGTDFEGSGFRALACWGLATGNILTGCSSPCIGAKVCLLPLSRVLGLGVSTYFGHYRA